MLSSSLASVQVLIEFLFIFIIPTNPGKLVADASIFMACAMTLAAFTISKTVRNGEIIEPVEDYQSGTIR
jgi:hypothetical protein